MKKSKINLLILFIFVLLGSIVFYHFFNAYYGNYVIINNFRINLIDIARTSDEQFMGLSFRKSLCKKCGMLFAFDDKQIKNFVMRNMNFPLDIVWIDDNTVIKIDKNLPPEGAKPKMIYSSSAPVNYVLEVNAGLSDRIGLREKQKIIFEINNK